MRMLNKNRILSVALASTLAFMLAVPAISTAAESTVDLGDASSFAVLAGSAITNTGPTVTTGSAIMTTITGNAGSDIGISPGSAVTGLESITGSSIYIADATAIAAKTDLLAAYNNADGRTPVTRIATELGGTTLTPGVYDSAAGTFQITGTLTLDGEGDPSSVFIFKTASTLVTASASNIKLINGATSCQIFWVVGSSATLGTDSDFVGTIMATTSITATTGASIRGRLLALNGAVTLDSNTITNNICRTTTPEPIEDREPREDREPIEEEPIDGPETTEEPEPIEEPEANVEPEPIDEPETTVTPEPVNTQDTTYVAVTLPPTGSTAMTAVSGMGAVLALAGFALFNKKK